MFQNSEDRLLYIVHDDIEVDFIFLITLGIKCMLELNDVWVKELLHDLQFPIFVSLVLVNFFDGYFLICFVDNSLEHHTE